MQLCSCRASLISQAMPFRSLRGIPYLPDGAVDWPARTPPPRSRGIVLFLFVAIFATLQLGWSSARDTWLERLVVHLVTVQPAAAAIRLLTPEIPAQALGPRIVAPGGGLNILNGCEGMEIVFLLAAAFFAVRMRWRTRLAGLGAGLSLVFLLNQARIMVLFYAFRSDKAVFDLLHTLASPVLLIAAVALFFYGWVRKDLPSVARDT